MWKVFLVISAVVLGGAIYLSYSNMGLKQEKAAEVQKQKDELAKRKSSITETEQELAQLENSVKTLNDEAETLQTEKIDLDAKVVQAEADKKAQESALGEAKDNLDKSKATMGDIAKIEGLRREMEQIRIQIEEADIEVSQLEGAVASAQVERDRLERVSKELEELRQDQVAGLIRGEFQSTVQKAYNQWGFVIVNGGNDQGVVDRAQLDVYRRGQPICKLLVTSVEPATSVGEIIPGSLAPGQTVQQGDTVVKTVRASSAATAPAGGGAAPAAPNQPAAGGMAPAAPQPSAPQDDPFGGGGNMSSDSAPDPFGGGSAPSDSSSSAPDPFGGGGGGDMKSGGDSTPDPFQ